MIAPGYGSLGYDTVKGTVRQNSLSKKDSQT
jgi:hypothetical protein